MTIFSRGKILLMAALAHLAAPALPVLAQSSSTDSLFIEENVISAGVPLSFGERRGPHLQLFGDHYVIGVQDYTMYFRSDQNFAWYRHGSHVGGELDPGDSGSRLMTLKKVGDEDAALNLEGDIVAKSISVETLTVGGNRIQIGNDGTVSIGGGALVVRPDGTVAIRAGNEDVLTVRPDGHLRVWGMNRAEGIPESVHVWPDGGVHLNERLVTWPSGTLQYTSDAGSPVLQLWADGGVKVRGQPVIVGGILERSYTDDRQVGCAAFGAGDCSGFSPLRKDSRTTCQDGSEPKQLYSAACRWTGHMPASGGSDSGGWCYVTVCQTQ